LKGVICLSRKTRVWFPGAMYHITSRGNRRSAIFFDDGDRKKYLDLLEETRERYPFLLHSYCLMDNHIHLLLETLTTPPGDIMKMLHSLYAIYFNKRHDLNGHVFQDRYKASLIDSPKYFLEASRYIHLNPLRAGLVEHPMDYKWSSFPAFVTSAKDPHVITEKILSHVPEPRRKNYFNYVIGGLSPNGAVQ